MEKEKVKRFSKLLLKEVGDHNPKLTMDLLQLFDDFELNETTHCNHLPEDMID